MKKRCLILLLAFCAPLLSIAAEPVNRPDIEELLKVMRIEKLLQGTMEQVQKMIPQMTANMLKQMPSVPANAAEKTTAMQAKIFAAVQEQMSWPNVKGDFVKIYAESLTPEETKGIIEFYKSPAGQAFLDKQPVIMEKSMLFQQKLMAGLMPKIQEIIKEEASSAAKEAPAKDAEGKK